MITAARYIKGYETLDAVKVASPVLRRGRASNHSSLFGDKLNKTMKSEEIDNICGFRQVNIKNINGGHE